MPGSARGGCRGWRLAAPVAQAVRVVLWLVLAAGLGFGPLGCQKENGQAAKPAGESGERAGAAVTGRAEGESQAAAEPQTPVEAVQTAPAGAAGIAADRPNQPPRGRLEASPLRGYANMTSINLTSASSADDYDLSQEMKRRWDFDGDGQWDTGLLRSDFVKWTFPKPGRYEPRLLLVDTGGLSDTCYGPAIEILEPCPAPEFALQDINPNSRVIGRTFSLEGFRGRPLLVWFASPSK